MVVARDNTNTLANMKRRSFCWLITAAAAFVAGRKSMAAICHPGHLRVQPTISAQDRVLRTVHFVISVEELTVQSPSMLQAMCGAGAVPPIYVTFLTDCRIAEDVRS
jgi:hypothetical protein